MTRVKTIKKFDGYLEIEGRRYKKTKITQVCYKCGSDRVERAICRQSERTKKITNKWVCWSCETGLDWVEDLNTKEGVFYE